MQSSLWGIIGPTTLPSTREEGKAKRSFLLPPLWSMVLHLGLSLSFCSILIPVSPGQPAPLKTKHQKHGDIYKCSLLVFFGWAALTDSVRPYFQFRQDNNLKLLGLQSQKFLHGPHFREATQMSLTPFWPSALHEKGKEASSTNLFPAGFFFLDLIH